MVTPSWQRHVRDATGTVDRAGYACCVLDQLRTRLRRRDVYAPGSTRWGDPRAELLTPETWTEQRDTLCCEDLALDPDPKTVIGQLTTILDAAWRRTAAGYAANPDLRIERRNGRDEIVLTALDADPEPASLTELRSEVEKLLPEVEIADLPLEVHGWTGFLGEYTHMAGTETRDPGRPETINRRIRQIRQLLGKTGYAIQPSPHRLASLADLYRLSATEGIAFPPEIKTAC